VTLNLEGLELLTDAGLNQAVTPAGRPVTLNVKLLVSLRALTV
jgi:hypothetical protein